MRVSENLQCRKPTSILIWSSPLSTRLATRKEKRDMTRDGFVEALIAIGGMVLIVILVPVLLFFLAWIVAVLSKAAGAFGLWFGRKTKLYDPSLPPVPPSTFERYRAQQLAERARAEEETRSRHIPQHIKEAVWWRDNG